MILGESFESNKKKRKMPNRKVEVNMGRTIWGKKCHTEERNSVGGGGLKIKEAEVWKDGDEWNSLVARRPKRKGETRKK
jgi:hypothetical protein